MRFLRGRYYVKNPEVVSIRAREEYYFIDATGITRVVKTKQAAEVGRLLERLARQVCDGDALVSETDADARLGPIIRSLLEQGIVLEGSHLAALDEVRRRPFVDNRGYHLVSVPAVCDRVVVAMSGSIVAGLMPSFILSLVRARAQRQLDLVLTEAASRFVSRELLECYGVRTWMDVDERTADARVAHVELGRRADLIVVMPATARTLAKLANGEASDLLSLTIAASRAPVLLVPVMNTAMWDHGAVRRNVGRLVDDGMFVMDPGLFYEAAEFGTAERPMYGGPGVMWQGPLGLMRCMGAVVAFSRGTASAAVDRREGFEQTSPPCEPNHVDRTRTSGEAHADLPAERVEARTRGPSFANAGTGASDEVR